MSQKEENNPMQSEMGFETEKEERPGRFLPLEKRGRLRSGNRGGDFFSAPRCEAKTRSGTACQAPAVRGKKRCRMHGGAKGSGAPSQNKNALKHGEYTAEALQKRKEKRQEVKALLRETDELLEQIKRMGREPPPLGPLHR